MRLDHLLSMEKVAVEIVPDFERETKDDEEKDSFDCCSIFRDQRKKRTPETWGCSSVGRAPALQAGGQGFESLHLHHGEDGEDGRERPVRNGMGS